MTDVYITADNIFSPLGLSSAENFAQLKKSVSGVKRQDDATMSEQPFYAALFNKKDHFINDDVQNRFTKFENLLISSISNALQSSGISPADKKTVLIISTTKGNISLLETETYSKELTKRISLNTSAKLVADYFYFVNQPIVISNACISGLLAIITGMRMIQSGQYENAVIAGADVISKFVLSGFQSFQAISEEPCKPFDAARKGVNLGEGAGTIILSANKKLSVGIKVSGGSISNDANHISGPSRTGEELHLAISKAMKDAGLSAPAIDFISAHGTATVYNDEMEAKAITLANLQSAPVNSLKGYYGHTLGAAGLIESIVTIYSMKENIIIPTMGFQHTGVTKPVNICTSLKKASLQNCLKTASGFGGCNAAVIFNKQ
ncbi:MAG: beta-ketoacyl synthase [Bacteroidia bacterium]|nr:beta-ketoacyl synthase [Bacteroidia bacterium]